jgi:hypothetical protein
MCEVSDDPRNMVGDAERALFGLAMRKLEGFVPRQ